MKNWVNDTADLLILILASGGFFFIAGQQWQENREKEQKCEGTPFAYVKRIDESITCYYKLDPSSYTTTIKTKGKLK